MARTSIRKQFLRNAIGSTLLALCLFAAGSFSWMFIDDADMVAPDGDTYRTEVIELLLIAMAVALPLGLVGAVIAANISSKRGARALEDVIQAARETTAHDLRRTLPVPERDDELRDLVVSFNELFTRLDDGFGSLGRFAADASHELRTPLAVIATELEVSLRHPRSSSEWELVARNGLDELRRLTSVVEGLLELARAGADAPQSRARVRLVECVDAVVAQLTEAAKAKGVALSGPVLELDALVDANAVMLETAIRNLVENGIRAAAGRVAVGIDVRGDQLVVTVDDDGPGLGSEPEKLFTPFHRGAGGRGAGLGLAIARRVAVAHQGCVAPAASPIGGARFELGVPRAL